MRNIRSSPTNHHSKKTSCDDGLVSGIAESRESPSIFINCTIKAIRDDLGSLLRETKNRSYAKRRRSDTWNENFKRCVKWRRNDTRNEDYRQYARRRRDHTRDGDGTIRATKTKRYARRRRDDTCYRGIR